jgi:hypothetical protein
MNYLFFISCLDMEGGDKSKGKGRATKMKSASARRENAEENPHKKRAQKKCGFNLLFFLLIKFK